jgi:hypothetical protein
MVNFWTEISSHIKQFEYEKWIFRNPFGMAGTGSLVFNNEELNFNKELIFKLLKESPLVLAPYFYRLMDLGFIFDGEELEVTWNLNSKMGHFKGGIVFEKIESLKRYINSNLNINFEEVLELEKKIVKIYGELGNKGIIQIDSFFYEENDLVKFFPLVEVNARKSMGYFINKLKVFLTEGGVGLFLSFNSSKIINVRSFQERKESLGEFLYSTSEKLGIIPISPIDGFLNSFFISGRTLEEVDNLKNVLWNKIKAPGQPLPNAFSFKLN